MNFVLVKLKPGADRKLVAARIQETTGLVARDNDEFKMVTSGYILEKTGILINFGLAVGLGLVIGLPLLHPFTPLLGSPRDPFEYCTRSIECIPRSLLRYILDAPTAAWIVGLCFRGLGGLFLLAMAVRAARRQELLQTLAAAFLFYYLYLHGWYQSWYWLSLLPLLPFADPRQRPAMTVLCVTAVAFYGLVLIFDCATAPVTVALVDLVEGLMTVVPPTLVLLRASRLSQLPGAADTAHG